MASILSLFSGCGGLDSGFIRSGHFEVVLAVDSDPVAVRTYNHNHGEGLAIQADLSKVSADELIALVNQRRGNSELRGVIGGPPCQPFSNGNRSRRDDARKHLPGRFASILRTLNQKFDLDFFVFENVGGINHRQHVRSFSRFKRQFEAAGFRLFEASLDSVDYGVPQTRPRVFVIGFSRTKYAAYDFKFPHPEATGTRSVGEVIAELPAPVFFKRNLTPSDIPYHPNHWAMNPKSRKFSDGTLKEGQSKGRSFRVLSRDKPSWTVAYGNREVHIHPSGSRRLSVLEAMLLQGFGMDYQLLGNLSEQIRQVCDAVPPPVAKALADQIHRFLAGDELAAEPTGKLQSQLVLL